MRTPYPTHTFEKDSDEALIEAPSENLALVDLETYPTFIDGKADYFDMMAHLSNEMQALTALAWKAPEHAFNLRLLLAENDRILEQTQPNRIMIASGNVRSYGELCLTTHERLFDAARYRTDDLLRGGRVPKLPLSRLLHVPPGVYSVYIYYHPVQAYQSAPPADYSVLLRHYPFPPPRVAPVRLSGLVPWAA